MKPSVFALLFTTLMVGSWAVCAQTEPLFKEDVGFLGVRRDREHWESPESLLSELRASDERTRLKALLLLGLTAKQAHHSVWSQASPAQVIGEKVVTPDHIKLTYAALGSDGTQQAVIALKDSEGQMTYAAVAVPTTNGWERVAAFDCWCKYEMYSGQDALVQFVQLRPAPQRGTTTPQRYELVFRASGGGTGIYTQNEAHYRIAGREVRRVLSFVDSYRSCVPGEKCKIEKRWFYPAEVKGGAGGILVSAGGQFTPHQTTTEIEFSLQDRYLRLPTCRTYTWNEVSFEYVPAGVAEPCEKAKR
jgi:hypothetical protein